MSSGGRWRLAMATLRAGAGLVIVSALAWGGWQVLGALRENSRATPEAAKVVPIKRTELRTSPGGVLDESWLKRTLALKPGVSLMELDLDRLRARVLDDGQVLTATLTRNFPDRLTVQITERVPVARIQVDLGGRAEMFLVARDGVVYSGTNYDPGMLTTLPWLGGFSLAAQGAGFRPIAGMDVVADLLARAQYEAEHLYHSWQVVSLARLASDRELEVTTKDNSTIIFTARTDFFLQLAKLDYMTEKLAAMPVARARIDLSLGREVPVMIEPLPSRSGAERPSPAPGFNVFPSSKNQREL